ncbi:MAG: ATP-binding protein [Cyclobacteriaceae bacterium]
MRSKKLERFISKGLFFKSVVEDGSDLVMIVDYDGVIHYHNNSLRFYGYAGKELTGKNFFDFIHHDEIKKVKTRFKTSVKREFNRAVEFQFKKKDGHFRSFEFNSLNLKHKEGIEGLILDCRDITQRKKDAEALILAQQAKEQFMANISHEIRTPINGIAGIASLLAGGAPPEEAKTYLNAIKSAAENLKVIINDILDISSIESGKLTFEKIGFNLEDLISGLEGTFSIQAKNKNVNIYFEVAPETHKIYFGDPVRLNQILINLIGNALKFTQKGSVTLSVSQFTASKDKCELKFEVKDTGIGIAADKLSRIFERFSQADSSVTRKYGGTGLGLTIVKQLVELQQGSIRVSSLEGVGSVFTVIIPYETSSDLKQQIRKINPANDARNKLLRNLHVLLVEDNDINQLYAGSILKSWGTKYDVAENGFVALEKLKTIKPDLILMDVQMPVMDGFEASRSIRLGEERIRQIPIIALTAHANQSVINKCTESGMNDYIPKPFTPGELQNILLRYKGKKSSESHSHKTKGTATKTVSNTADFDLTYLIQVSNHDRSFITQILQSFLENANKTLESVRSGLKSGETKNLASIVHKIKPSLTMIGAERPRQLAAEIEELSEQANSKGKVKGLAKEFCARLEATISGLQALDMKRI